MQFLMIKMPMIGSCVKDKQGVECTLLSREAMLGLSMLTRNKGYTKGEAPSQIGNSLLEISFRSSRMTKP